MAYRACQKSKAPKLPRSGSNNISASSISTIAEVRTEEGKLYLFVAIDRTSKVAFARLFDKANTAAARAFLEQLIEAIPYNIEVVLTDNGIQFADLPKYRSGATARFRGHPFDRACSRYGIEHRLTSGPTGKSKG
jgi:hypothetical protein